MDGAGGAEPGVSLFGPSPVAIHIALKPVALANFVAGPVLRDFVGPSFHCVTADEETPAISAIPPTVSPVAAINSAIRS